MKRVTVVTDSSANLPERLVRELGIRIVPALISVNGATFRDGEDITSQEIYQLLRRSRVVPTTAAPSAGDFLRVFARAARETPSVVSIHMAPALSATYGTALLASQLLDEAAIRVVACRTAAMAQGFAVLEAARAAAGGAALEDVVSRAEEVAGRATLLATIGSLEYLHRGGRIGSGAALLGTALRIKPLLSLTDGQVSVFAKPRTLSRAIRILVEQTAQQTRGQRLHAAVLHADMPVEAAALRDRLARQFDCAELYVVELTPVMGCHTGPDVLGVASYGE